MTLFESMLNSTNIARGIFNLNFLLHVPRNRKTLSSRTECILHLLIQVLAHSDGDTSVPPFQTERLCENSLHVYV